MSPRRITVAIVDDHALFRTGLRLLLEQDPRVCVSGEGASGKEALEIAESLAPEVMLLDVEMDRTSADATIRTIVRTAPSVRIIVLTMHRDSVLRRQLLQAGAVDYLTKDVPGHELVDHIVQAARNAQPRAIARYLEPRAPDLLSQRELQVLRMIGQARSNKDIAALLSIAEGTVKRHTTNIYTKLGARSRIDAVRKASRLGLF